MNSHTPKPRPVKYCADCGVVIADAETPVHVYNARIYCPACAAERTLYNRANAQKQFRLNRKERNCLQREQNKLLRIENAELRRRIGILERLNEEANGYV